MGKPAVYLIRHRDSGKVYVGSAANLSKRWSRHRQELREGVHRNKHLQSAWTLHGEPAFDWSVVAVVERSERIALEQRVIDVLRACDPVRGYNRARIAGVSYGGLGRTWTPEQRERQSRVRRSTPNRLAPGEVCAAGHLVDGSYSQTRTGRDGTVVTHYRCQDCNRKAARERQRNRRGVPLDHPPDKHYHRRGRASADGGL